MYSNPSVTAIMTTVCNSTDIRSVQDNVVTRVTAMMQQSVIALTSGLLQGNVATAL